MTTELDATNDQEKDQQGQTTTTAEPNAESVHPNRDPTDPDYQALLALEQEEGQQGAQGTAGAAEGTGTAADGEQVQQQDGQAAAGAETQPQDQGQPQGEGTTQTQAGAIMIPKARLDDVLEENRKLRETQARLQGRLEAVEILRAQPGGDADGKGQEQEEQPQTPESRLATIQDQRKQLAEQYESGDLTFAQFRDQDLALEGQIRQLDRELILASVPKPAATQSATDLYREEKLDQLEGAHPYAKLIPDNHPGWDLLTSLTDKHFTDQGRRLDPNNPADDLAWRTKLAELTDVYGPMWVQNAQVPAAQQGQPQGAGDGRQAATAQPQRQPSPQAQARAKKLDLASDLPPDISQMGGRTNAGDVWTDDRIVNLSEEEYEALPPATKSAIARRLGENPSTAH